MSADARTVIAAVKTRLQLINGAGGYVYDLSAADQVVLHAPVTPTTMPCLGVYFLDMRSEQQAGREPLGYYRRTLRVAILGFVAGVSDSPSDRMLAAADLLDDISTALESDRTLGTSVALDVIIQGEALSGSEDDLPSTVGIVQAVAEIWWRVRTGM